MDWIMSHVTFFVHFIEGTHLYDFYTIFCELKSFYINIFTSHGGLLIVDKYNATIFNKLEMDSL
jgi:hypothetical protein